MSPQKRKSFADVARTVEDSDFVWLADDMAAGSLPQSDSRIFDRMSSGVEEIAAYRNVRLSAEDMIGGGEDTLEDILQDVSRIRLNKKVIRHTNTVLGPVHF